VRKYQAIWEQIKRDGSAYVEANADYHARIIKAVIKEKYIDVGFKVITLENHKKYKLEVTSIGNLVCFKLEDATPTYMMISRL
jgi:hypothetical protein